MIDWIQQICTADYYSHLQHKTERHHLVHFLTPYFPQSFETVDGLFSVLEYEFYRLRTVFMIFSYLKYWLQEVHNG